MSTAAINILGTDYTFSVCHEDHEPRLTDCAFCLNMAKADHQEGEITFEKAKTADFKNAGSENSLSI